jgi:hypothetical protein
LTGAPRIPGHVPSRLLDQFLQNAHLNDGAVTALSLPTAAFALHHGLNINRGGGRFQAVLLDPGPEVGTGSDADPAPGGLECSTQGERRLGISSRAKTIKVRLAMG